MKQTTPLLLLLLIFPLTQHCAKATPRGVPVEDDLGRTIRIQRGSGGIVSLAPNITELVIALAGEGVLAGRTRFCPVSPKGKRIPIVGGMVRPDPERIARVRPRLVLLSYEGNTPRTARTLDTLHIPRFVVRIQGIPGLLSSIRRLGRALGVKTDRTIAQIRRSLSAMRGRLKGKRLFFHIPGGRSVYTFGRQTLLHALIEHTGAANAAADFAGRFPKPPPESLTRLPIDRLIILAAPGSGPAKSAAALWKRLQPQRTPLFSAEKGFFRPGIGQIDAMKRLTDRL